MMLLTAVAAAVVYFVFAASETAAVLRSVAFVP